VGADRVDSDDVQFSYSVNEQVLRGISFKISSGEFVGFVGQSGAGKSTIVSLISRFYNPDNGDILANDVSIDEFSLSRWREKISMVRQDPFIFSASLRYNLTMGREFSQPEIERIAEIAKVDEFIDTLPDGFSTTLGEDGVKLSGGQ